MSLSPDSDSLVHVAASRQLSSAEEALWLLQEERRSGAYNEGVLLRMRTVFTEEELKHAVWALAEQHPALRTVYLQQAEGLKAIQVEASEAIEIRAWKVTGEEQAVRRAETDFADPFDLQKGVVRVVLYRHEEQVWMLIALHHIACDGWSMHVLQESLSALLSAQKDSGAATAASSPYARFAAAETDYINSDLYIKNKQYWLTRLEGLGEVSRLDAGGGPDAYLCLEETMNLSRSALNATADAQGVSRFVVACSAAQVALAHFLDRPDLVIATPFSNRSRDQFAATVGLFTNTLLLRQTIDANETAEVLLRRTRATLGGAIRNGRFPYSHLVRLFRAQIPADAQPYQLYFSYREAPQELLANPQFAVVGHPKKVMGNFDLHLEVFQEEQSIRICLHINTGRYSPKLAGQLLSAYARILAALAEHPGSPVGDLPALSDGDHRDLMRLSAGPFRPYEADAGYIAAFQQSLQNHRSAPALIEGSTSWSYDELDRWSDALALQLLSVAAWKPGGVAGVYLPRGRWLVASILAIWKAGGIYLPLDPDLPRERLHLLIADSGIAVAITSSIYESLPPQITRVTLPDEPAKEHDLKATAAAGNDGAYLLYTSGSTGKPKGVVVSQSGMMNHLLSKVDGVLLDRGTRLAQTATQNFDVSVWQMLAPLLAGGVVCIADSSTVLEPARLLEYLRLQEITIVQMVPSYLAAALDAYDHAPVPLPALRFLVCAGEPLTALLVRQWQARFPGCTIFNGYGPTEGSDNIAVYTVPENFTADRVPIGAPLANLNLYVVNSLGRLAPEGVTGEIWVSGVGVALGYWQNTELTNASFFPDPFQPGRRLFKTGDLGHRNEAGLLEFHGRKDLQIKIRGQRVEPEEVEAALLACEPVKQAAVKGWPLNGGLLCAYVVLCDGSSSNAHSLREQLLERLPAYLVPAVFQFLPALPLTQSGKVARAHLPEPQNAGASGGQPPESPTEQLLCTIWEELLQRKPIYTDDEFFQIGGHSLLLARLSNRIAEQMGIVIPFSALYRLTDIRSLARYLDLQPKEIPWSDLEEVAI